MTYDIAVLDPRSDAEPDWWEAWRVAAGMPANWAWPLVRAGSLSSDAPYALCALLQGSVVRAVLGQAVEGPRLGRRWPVAGYLHVQAPQSSAQPGWWFDTGEPAEQAELLRLMVRAVRTGVPTKLAGVLWRQLGEADRVMVPGPRYVRGTEPVAVLSFPEGNYDGWARATLRAKRRRDLGRVMRRLDTSPELTVAYGRGAEVASAQELAGLTRGNFAKYGAARRELGSGPRSVIWQTAAANREDVTVLAYRRGCGRLIAAMLLLEHPRLPICLAWGALPIEAGGMPGLYFDMIHRTARRTAAAGGQGLVLGKGLAGLKEDLGAQLVPQYAAVGALR